MGMARLVKGGGVGKVVAAGCVCTKIARGKVILSFLDLGSLNLLV